jgi:hypothetical protein
MAEPVETFLERQKRQKSEMVAAMNEAVIDGRLKHYDTGFSSFNFLKGVHCWRCHKNLSNITALKCPKCGGLKCTCGSCSCSKAPSSQSKALK